MAPIPRSDSKVDDHLVLFQLNNETRLPCVSTSYSSKLCDSPGSEGSAEHKEAFCITLDPSTAIDQPHRLITFGSDPRQCNMLLQSLSIEPVHCAVWTQLNSGPNVLVISNHSGQIMQYWDTDSLRKRMMGTINSHCYRATKDLLGLRIGPYCFSVHYCRDDWRSRKLESWFGNQMWKPVTEDMYNCQIGKLKPEWQIMGTAGEGANGEITKRMEMHTGLVVAFKQFPITSPWQKQLAAQEIGFMKVLRHVSGIVLSRLFIR